MLLQVLQGCIVALCPQQTDLDWSLSGRHLQILMGMTIEQWFLGLQKWGADCVGLDPCHWEKLRSSSWKMRPANFRPVYCWVVVVKVSDL